MNHRIHPVTQVCEVCGAMAGVVEHGEPCAPKEEGWYWVKGFSRTFDDGQWFAAYMHNADVWTVPSLDYTIGHRSIYEIGPRIYPPS